MISALISRLVILVLGTLYPAYSSYKAVKNKDIKLYVKWMMYWIVFALFTAVETFTDIFLAFWFPFYYELKILLVLWLLSPVTRGSSVLYRRVIHPLFLRREQEIDELINKATDQGYNALLDIGCKGMTLATNAIMQTAVKGGNGLLFQIRKSYSLNDLSQTDGTGDAVCKQPMKLDDDLFEPTANYEGNTKAVVRNRIEKSVSSKAVYDYCTENERSSHSISDEENVEEYKSTRSLRPRKNARQVLAPIKANGTLPKRKPKKRTI